jgi:hypothetical protein
LKRIKLWFKDVGPISPNLLEIELTVRDHEECAGIYAPDVALTDAQICADVPEGGKGVCMVRIYLFISYIIPM